MRPSAGRQVSPLPVGNSFEPYRTWNRHAADALAAMHQAACI